MDLKLSGGDTVAKLKHKVAKEYDGYEADKMRLVYTTAAGVNGELTNDQLTLFEVCGDRTLDDCITLIDSMGWHIESESCDSFS